MKPAVCALVVVGVCLGLGLARARPAAACDRPGSPLDDAATAVAVSDAVVFVELRRVDGGVATGAIVDVLRGGGGEVAKGKEIHIRGPLSRDEATRDGRRCGLDVVAAGQQYLAVLWSPVPGTGEYHLVSPGGAAITADPARIAALSRAVRSPAAASAWRIHDDLATRLVLDPAHPATRSDLVAHVIVRNLSKRRRPLVRTAASSCEPAIAVAEGAALPARTTRPSRVPAARTEIVPGEAARIALGGITTPATANRRYVPIARPGRYAITVRCTRFTGAAPLATAPLVVSLP